MAMYVQLLSAVLTTDQAMSYAPGELLSLARTRRNQMLASTYGHRCAERDLAYDVDYDCALIRLCATQGILTAPSCFGQPRVERARLELALARAGLDVVQRELAGGSVLP
jgi:hypothetical protein